MEEIELKSASAFDSIKIWNYTRTKYIIVNSDFITRFEALSQHDVIGSFSMQEFILHYTKDNGFDFNSKVIDVLNSMGNKL